jgi:hypothetical protein
MKGGIGKVTSKIVKRIIVRLLNSMNKKLQSSGVSKQKSHNLFVPFPHIVLENIQFFSQSSGELERAALEAFMMPRE